MTVLSETNNGCLRCSRIYEVTGNDGVIGDRRQDLFCSCLMGEGGFGKVYKGQLNDKSTVKVLAIKKLNSESMKSFQERQMINSTY